LALVGVLVLAVLALVRADAGGFGGESSEPRQRAIYLILMRRRPAPLPSLE
jgi:hypothetical protein